jgi:hypothetical protein
MERKKFIFLITAAATIVAVPAWYYYSGSTAYDQSLTKPQLLSNIWDTETMVGIGMIYLKQHPGETDESRLTKLLSENISLEKGAIATSINQKIKEDYKTGRIVTIDGWILSVTEGRQCALYSLTQPK